MITSHGRLRFLVVQKQQESWDCGLACVQMVLATLCEEGTRASQQQLAERVEGKSVWTVDLAYLLVEYGVDVKYWTDCTYVDESEYSGEAFYASSLAKDAKRVNRLLGAASAEGVHVVKRTLSAAELWNLMSEEETLVIALVDQRVLYRRVTPSRAGSQAPSRTPSRPSSRPPSRANSSVDLASFAASAGGAASKRGARGSGESIGSRAPSCADLSSLAEEATLDCSADGSGGGGSFKGGSGGRMDPSYSPSIGRRNVPSSPASVRRGKPSGQGGSKGSRKPSRASSCIDLSALAEDSGDALATEQQEEPTPYQGHYVLILGIDDSRGGFLISDPAKDDERTFIHADALEAARHAKGTDEDLLLISMYPETPPMPPATSGSQSKLRSCLKRVEQEEAATDGLGDLTLR